MKKLIVFALIFGGSMSLADVCKNPTPLFGKVLAICGDKIVTHVGETNINVLGVSATQTNFELAYCSGGGRMDLQLATNSEGYELSWKDIVSEEKYTVSNMWNTFQLISSDENGQITKSPCVEYNDTRTNIEYIR